MESGGLVSSTRSADALVPLLQAEQAKRGSEQRKAAQLQNALKKRLAKVEQERDHHVAWYGGTTEQAREYAREIKRLRAELAEARRRAAG